MRPRCDGRAGRAALALLSVCCSAHIPCVRMSRDSPHPGPRGAGPGVPCPCDVRAYTYSAIARRDARDTGDIIPLYFRDIREEHDHTIHRAGWARLSHSCRAPTDGAASRRTARTRPPRRRSRVTQPIDAACACGPRRHARRGAEAPALTTRREKYRTGHQDGARHHAPSFPSKHSSCSGSRPVRACAHSIGSAGSAIAAVTALTLSSSS